MEKKYEVFNVGSVTELESKLFLKEKLNLTGMEVSINAMKAGKGYDFVHFHKENEELYIVTSGIGIFYVDGEEFSIKEGDAIKVLPNGNRALVAKTDMTFICIQAKENSLNQYTMTDGAISKEKASWMK